MIEPVLRWPGAKWRIAPWIVNMFPRHEVYLEPFFGSGAVFFNKSPSGTETINDIDGEIINLFSVCRDCPEELAKRIEMTPYGRDEYLASLEPLEYVDPVEAARRFLVRTWQGFGGKTNRQASWAHDRTNLVFRPKYWSILPDRILNVVTRLKQVQIECMNALELIPMYNSKNTLLYVDPPYLKRDRTNLHYRHEFSSVSEHEQLLELCLQHKGPCIISAYDDPIYEAALSDWDKKCMQVATNAGGSAKEIVFLNPKVTFEQRLF
ncbi:DNA adenine methylase [uncultured Succiniclasticum sp.]|uniref:DNA adenine methylase n=1 Tax=uncultured Succiniclasticum sp. TaxID=1500547 RepID=UPI0025F5E457|nr:DNA adenine methylase [uncultured Succiniclasticum sp.]